jgi:uncharacterized protein (TIGR00369 family)
VRPMTPTEIKDFFGAAFGSSTLVIDQADGRVARVRLPYNRGQLRPGGTISGPTMMSLADSAMYALVLSAIGFEPLSVTTNLSINFLRKPAPKDLIAEARMLKLGKALAVADVVITSDGDDDPVAHAVVTYSIPPKKEGAAN